MKRTRKLIALVAAVSLVLAACGDDETADAPAATEADETSAPEATDAPAATDAPEATDAPAATDAPPSTDVAEGEDPLASLYATESRPFTVPDTGKIAVKVINDYGDEVMPVFEVN